MQKDLEAAATMPGKKLLVVLLCFLLTDLPLLAQQQAPRQAPEAAPAASPAPVLVASVTGYTAGATVNDSPLDPNRALHTNDLIKTDSTGRIRMRLFGGGFLDVGSQTSFKIIRNDPSVQQTVIELFSGQLRSEAPEFKAPAASFEIRAPQGRVMARSASDMYVQASPARTVVRMLKGSATAKAMSSQSAVEIAANQSLELTPAGAGQVQVTPLNVQQEAVAQTGLAPTQAATNAPPAQEETPPPPVKKSHLKRNLLILGVIGAAGAGAAAAASGRGGSSTTPTPAPTPTGSPTIPPQ
jgi:hypothetical protein